MQTFKIIRFTPDKLRYYPKSVEADYLKEDKRYCDHTLMEFAADRSRIGGPIVDLPEEIEYPDDMYFVAQLNMEEFSQHDPSKLLPKTGFLYFFVDEYQEDGLVYYADVQAESLNRVIFEHDQCFFDGCLIDTVFQAEESFESRFTDEDSESVPPEMEWSYFAGSEISKMFGIYTHCQKHEEEIREITASDSLLLLQVGEDFTDAGVLSVMIEKEHLKVGNYNRCTFELGIS